MSNLTPESRLRSLLNDLSQDNSVGTFAQNLLYTKPLLVNFRHDIENAFLAKRNLEFSQIFKVAGFLWLLPLYTTKNILS
jgi:hypothetical protein